MPQSMVCILREKEAYYGLVTVISMAETSGFWSSFLVTSSVVIAMHCSCRSFIKVCLNNRTVSTALQIARPVAFIYRLKVVAAQSRLYHELWGSHVFPYGAKSEVLFDASLRYLSQSSSTHS
jgi:hypothetical protein